MQRRSPAIVSRFWAGGLVWLAAGACAGAPALAAGWFGGISYGGAAWRHYSLARDSTSLDNSDRGGLLFGGYQFTRNFGVAVSAIDMGGMRAEGPLVGGFVDRQEATALSAVLIGIVPLRERLGLFGTFGAAHWRHKVRYDDNPPLFDPGPVRETSRGSSPCWGLGLNYYLTGASTWGVHAEWNRYIDVGNEKESRHSLDIDLFTIGFLYRFPR